MTVTGRILWLDNDPGYIQGFVTMMRRSGLEVTVMSSVSAADQALRTDSYDLFLLDVMIPVTDGEELGDYSAVATDEGYKTGLAFYRKHRAALEGRTTVLVLTVRVDRELKEEFIKAGLPPALFITKMEVRDASEFLKRIKRLLGPADFGASSA